ncbi:DUF3857 domain-containing protein [Fluviicola taffensis]|uniref:DUF3857 domain-containing protein n=1 Tax=Fluviicola taffensis (strain DSM 16823 / NCIMB 13979 / RW262) TaxID=755732 RepID=F2IDX5_FLUTR|nr:DUF3857 domain-containing protein [Fluviicola taffensis]AEA44517.1 hypothetical protein Fluta_2532 [Fluviicola taffensis DSM 16823]
MKQLLIILIACGCMNYTIAQSEVKPIYLNYDWKSTPEKIEASEKDKLKDEVMLFEKRSVEFAEYGDGFYQMVLLHNIQLINTDAGIEENNKVYISNKPGAKVLKQKARVIKPDGKIINLKESDIQESKNENGEVEYRYFALEGLEKGSYIEYLHYMSEEPTLSGASLYLQSSIDKKKVEYDIICPKHLELMFHSVNGMPNFKKDTLNADVNRSFIDTTNIEGLKDEESSAYNANLMKCYYKLQKNTSSGKSNLYTYLNVSKNVYSNLYETPSKKSSKKITELTSENALGKGDLESKLRNLEYNLKTEYGLTEEYFDGISDLDNILTKKVTNETGTIKLMIACLKALNVKFEVVMTSNRDENPFLTDYEAYNFLDETLIYLSDLKKYWSAGIFSRIGFSPFEFNNNYGLFIEERIVNEQAFGVGKVKYIGGTKSEESIDEINTIVTFDASLSEPTVQVERKLSGYKSMIPQFILDMVQDDAKKTELKEDVLLYIDNEAKLTDVTYENDNGKLAGKEPFVARGKISGTSFIEKAGNKTLLKIGMLIGPQAEMYNKEARKLPVSTQFTRQYVRKIIVNIPEGVTVKNPEVLNFNIVTNDEKALQSGFVSSYEMKGNQLIVTINEFYNKVNYTVSEYEMYEKVINGAADFNKLVIVLE